MKRTAPIVCRSERKARLAQAHSEPVHPVRERIEYATASKAQPPKASATFEEMKALTLLRRMRVLLAVLAAPSANREDSRRPSEQCRESHRGVHERVGRLGLVDGEAALGGRRGRRTELLPVRASRKRSRHSSERSAEHPGRAGAQAEVSDEEKVRRKRSFRVSLFAQQRACDNKGCNGRART